MVHFGERDCSIQVLFLYVLHSNSSTSPVRCFYCVQERSSVQSVLKLEKVEYMWKYILLSQDFVIHIWKYETDVLFLLNTEEKPEAT